jgi:hypothetical protein
MRWNFLHRDTAAAAAAAVDCRARRCRYANAPNFSKLITSAGLQSLIVCQIFRYAWKNHSKVVAAMQKNCFQTEGEITYKLDNN